MFNSKVFLAEFIGTFALVFIGAGAGIVNAGLVGVALAHGFTLAAFIYAYGHISGTHVNPAVTFALALNGTVKWGQAAFYWIAQFAGAILAAFLLKTVVGTLGADISAGATVGALTESQPIYAMVIEAILTFFLVNTILHTAVAGKGGAMAGWAIGMTYAFAILAGAPFTGASLNPARTFGPAIFSAPSFTDVYTYVIYFFGPLIGATLAVIVFNFLDKPEDSMEDLLDEDDDEDEILIVEEEPTPVKAKKPAVRRKTVKE
ncbi:MAG: aquaporin [Anaerolineales bacterium]|nr:aquaporin [Anaerolineales bacterium]